MECCAKGYGWFFFSAFLTSGVRNGLRIVIVHCCWWRITAATLFSSVHSMYLYFLKHWDFIVVKLT